MKVLIKYFKEWNITRIIRAILAGALIISYYYSKEPFFLFIGIMLGVQAVFNISCPGGSCEPTYNSDTKNKIKVEKYKRKN